MAQLGVLEVRVQPDLTGFGAQVSRAMSGVGGAMARLGATVGRDLVSIGSSVGVAAAAATAGLATIGIRTAASLETAELQFTTLLGSATEAKERVQELFQFARDTPFSADEVIKASRTMQIFGGDALAATENLTMVGDAAAGVGANFDEVAFWVSRSYALMQAGRPWGEAALRLQELGVLSGDARTEIEAMAESGASAADQWGVFAEDLSRYAGSMEGLQNSFAGLREQLTDMVQLGLAEAFRPAFESLSDLMMAMRDAGDSEAFAAAMAGLNVVMRPLSSLFDRAADAVRRFGDLSQEDVFAGFDRFGQIVGAVRANVIQLGDSLGPLVPILGGIAAGFAATYASGIPLIGMLIPGFSGVTGALIGFLAVSDEARTSLANFGSVMLDAAQGGFAAMEGSIETVVDALGSTFAGVLDAITPALATLVRDLMPALGGVAADVAPPLGRVVEAFARLAAGAITGLAPMLAAIASGIGAILGAGLDVVADAMEVLGNNAALAGPALAGVAAAVAAFKIANFVRNLDLAKTSLSGLQTFMDTMRVQMALAPPNVTMFDKIKAGAEVATRSIGGLSAAIGTFAIGAGIAAAVGIITAHFQRQAEEAREAEARIDELAATIRDLGDSTSVAGDYMTQLADDGDQMALMMRDAVGDTELLAQALRGNESAVAEVQSRFAEWGETADLTGQQLSALMGELGTTSLSIGEDPAHTVEALKHALEGAQEEYSTAVTNSDEFATSQDRAAQAVQNYRDSIDLLRMEFDNLFGSQLNLEQSELRLADNFARLAEAAGAAGASIDASTEIGRQNREVFNSQVQAIWDFTSAQVEAGTSSTDAANAALGQRNALIQTATQFGLTKEQATAYIDQLGLTPESIHTLAQLADQEAKRKAQEYQNRLNTIDKTDPFSLITASVFGIDAAESALNNVARERVAEIVARVRETFFDWGGGGSSPAARSIAPMGLMPTDEAAAMAMRVSPLAATTDTITLRPRTYRPALIEQVSQDARQPISPVIENRVYVGNQQITDIVRQEARVIERDRSMRYLTGVPSGVTF